VTGVQTCALPIYTDTPVFAAKVGKQDAGVEKKQIGTDETVTPPIYIEGNFYKSHNASGWDIDNTVAMKFALHKAKFSTAVAGEINFVNEQLFERTLIFDAIELHEGSSHFRVTLPNHGFSKGDKVSIRNISTPNDTGSNPPTIKGVFRSAFENLRVVRVETDHIVVTNAGGTNGQPSTATGYVATQSAKIGGTGATINDNKVFEDITLITNPFNPPTGTSIEWKLVTTSSVGLNNVTHTPTKLPYINIVPNDRIFFDASRRINSLLNEPASNVTTEKKSLIVTAILRSSNSNLSPVIDISRMTAALTKNRLNDPQGTSDNVTQNINDVFDDLYLFKNGSTPTGIAPSVGTVAGKIKFSASSGALKGTYATATDNEYKIDKTPPTTGDIDLRSQLQANQYVTCNGQRRKVTLVTSEYFLVELPFNPPLATTSINVVYADPSKMNISTDDLDVANVLSRLNVGKLVTITGATGDRNFQNKKVLDVVFDATAQSDKCVVTFDHETTQGAGSEGSTTLTILQKDRFVDEIAPVGGSVSAKYVCKKLVVSRPSNALRIQFDASRDSSCTIELYYKIEQPNSTRSFRQIPWTKAEFNIDVDGTLKAKTPDPDSNSSTYSEYQSTINDLPEFTGVQAKIVMRGGNAGRCPKIKNFRMIVLDE
jgi:hypothetical protein